MNSDEKYMKEAIRQAKKAYALGEVPIGCVIVYDGKIIGRGYNRRNTDKNTLAHAEITAINKASKKIGDWRLEDCTLYVTLEPCQMCAGAIVQARVTNVVMGSMNPKAGCGGSILNVLEMPEFNHQVHVTRGYWKRNARICSLLFSRNCAFEIKKKKKLKKLRLNKHCFINRGIYAQRLTKPSKNSILKRPCSRGVSGALYLQSALVGVMFD